MYKTKKYVIHTPARTHKQHNHKYLFYLLSNCLKGCTKGRCLYKVILLQTNYINTKKTNDNHILFKQQLQDKLGTNKITKTQQ